MAIKYRVNAELTPEELAGVLSGQGLRGPLTTKSGCERCSLMPISR